ncbi:FAD/NAD(P)-binding protein [Chelatococcus sambhunathii]|uniref:FAD/NAD(P)-binding protein n=1 Tax=Chelatococcus sambhunathii TaxID=363953 RepID=A0ABU1DBR4_9HYPH|nr:FAD/NAD(P)-binding protein [Chelatococcus sambhunathii]MDR4305546.1 FAD/NAD(P)-binding protein [Chelatococcus sambhunathii]
MTDGRGDHGPRPTVAIIGGGFAGAGLAYQLARRAPGAFHIVVFEPRDRLGCGVAYSTTDPAHRINVPAARMSFVPSDPCHFDRWLKADGELRRDPAALMPDGRAFPRRAAFGRYAAETIEPFVLDGAIEHRRSAAVSITRADRAYSVLDDKGQHLAADIVAFAATHPAPQTPQALEPLAGDPRLVVDTQNRAALDAIPSDARILIVGTGLTMADIVASLEARGHQGQIAAVSRRGLLSRGHPAQPGEEYGSFDRNPSGTARALVRRIRRTIAAAAAEGRPWQHVMDAVRAQGPAIWAALPQREREIVARRLRPFWDVHRFRVAPQVEAAIARLRNAGQLTVMTGEPVAASRRAASLSVDLRLRGGGRYYGDYDFVLLATGPAHRRLCDTSPLVGSLAAQGLVRLDPIGLGLEVDERSVAVGTDGRPTPSFWIVGPLARATFGELMGLPEVARHAEFVASSILRSRGQLGSPVAEPERAVA